jgi:hypothetical protein
VCQNIVPLIFIKATYSHSESVSTGPVGINLIIVIHSVPPANAVMRP